MGLVGGDGATGPAADRFTKSVVGEDPTRVVVADAHPLFRLGVRIAALSVRNLDFCAEVGDAEALLASIETIRPKVAVVGTNVPAVAGGGKTTGLGATMAVRRRFPDVAVIVVAQRPREAELFDALRFGAAAYLGRAMEIDALADVISRVARGAYVFDAAVLARRAQVPTPLPVPVVNDDDRDDAEFVTAREVEVLTLIGSGRSNRAIGEAMQVSDQTVKNYVTSILRKLGVSDRTQAVVEAIRLGLFKP
jgi:DNA-binding NarL/FixJ family response regulator